MENPKKILVVEDERSLREALLIKLERAGFSAVGASNGEDGLQKIAVETPDLILLDIIMPVMDGLTMLSKLRENPALKYVPVIALTNLNSMGNISDVVSSGANTFLIKSNWKISDVVDKVIEKLK